MIIVLTSLACTATVLLCIALIVTSQKKISLESKVNELRGDVKDLHSDLKEAYKAAIKAFPLNNQTHISEEYREGNTLSFELIRIVDFEEEKKIKLKGISCFLAKVKSQTGHYYISLLKGKLPKNAKKGVEYMVFIEENLVGLLEPRPPLAWFNIERIEITEIK